MRPAPSITPARRGLRLALALAIALAALWASLRGVSLPRLRHVLEDLSIPLFLAVGLGTVVVNLIKSFKLGVLLKPTARVGFRTLFGAETISILTDVLFPFRLLELVKGLVVSRSSGLPVALVMGAQVVEKAIEFSVLLFLCVLGTFCFPLPPWLAPGRWMGLAVLVLLMLFILFCRHRLQGAPSTTRRWSVLARVQVLLSQLTEGMRSASVSPTALLKVLLMTVVEWCLFGILVWLTGQALGLNLGPVAVIGFLIANALAFAFPASSAGSVGIYEFIGAETLALLADVPREEAFALALSIHVLLIVFGALSGIIGLQLVGLNLTQLRGMSGRKE